MSGLQSYLPSLFNNASGGGLTLLDTLYGIGTAPGGSGNPVQALQSAERNQTQDVKITAAKPMVTAAIGAYTAAVNSAKSVTQLLANPAFMNVLLTANGMADQIGYTALATKALTSNLSDPTSLANTLSDTRWKTAAKNYNFASASLASFQNPAAIAAMANLYATVTWQTGQDTVTPGLANALAFKTQASTITSVDQILGNPTMRSVVTTALGIPQQIAFQSLNAQQQAIATRVDIANFKNPKFVETFIQQYLIANAQNAASSSSSTPSLTALAIQAGGYLA